MSLSGGLLAGYWIAKGDPFWTYSSGLAGVSVLQLEMIYIIQFKQ
jgi:hypothetical protein